MAFGSNFESAVSDPSVCLTCKIIKTFSIFRLYIFSLGPEMTGQGVTRVSRSC